MGNQPGMYSFKNGVSTFKLSRPNLTEYAGADALLKEATSGYASEVDSESGVLE